MEGYENSRVCVECSKPIFGREIKRFCSAVCTTNNYNKRNREKIEFFKKVNSILVKNRGILKNLAGNSWRCVGERVMVDIGFDFRYHTGSWNSKGKGMVFIVYDYAYFFISENQVKVYQLKYDSKGEILMDTI